jgi:mevalonate kinase
MESHFHGSSSGTDPLCIYTDSPIHIDLKGEPVIVDPGVGLFGKLKPFLINTLSSGYTSELVLKFLEKIKEPNLRNTFMNDYVPYVNRAVEQCISGNPEIESILEISRKQLKYFSNKIPGRYHDAWNQGIDTGLYALKLCGSGGGGMVLGFSQDFEKSRDYLLKNHHIPIAAL